MNIGNDSDSDEEPLQKKKDRKSRKNAELISSDDDDIDETDDDFKVSKRKRNNRIKSSEEDSELSQEQRRTLRPRKKVKSFDVDDDEPSQVSCSQKTDDGDDDFVVNDDSAEKNSDDEFGDEFSTPISTTKKINCFSTPNRKSSRLHSKDVDRNSKTVPNRREYLERISPKCTKSPTKNFFVHKKKVSNNLVMGAHSYNTEKSYDLDDSLVEDEDFIASDNEEEEVSSEESSEKRHSKKSKRKKEKQKATKKPRRILNESEDSNGGLSDIEKVCGKSDKEESDDSIPKIRRRDKQPQSESRKAFPKRTRTSNNERTLEKLRKLRESKKNGVQVSNSETEDNSEEPSYNTFGDDSNEIDDFIDDDEDDASSDGNNLDVHDMLKDVVDRLKRKNKKKKKKQPVVTQPARTERSGFMTAAVSSIMPKKYLIKGIKDRTIHSFASSSSSDNEDDDYFLETKELMEAVKTDDVNSVIRILSTHHIINDCFKSRTALHLACKLGHFSIVEYLLTKSANTKLKDKFHFIPLAYAAKNKHPDCLKILLPKTDFAIFCRDLFKNYDNMTLLHLIVSEPISTRDNVNNDTVTCLAMFHAFNSKMFYKFLSQTDAFNCTPLHMAIMQNQVEVVRFLLKHIFRDEGDNLLFNECTAFNTEEGGNILHFCTAHSQECLVELIPYLALRINEQDNNGFSPLMYAAEKYTDCLEVLLNFNASVNVADFDGVTPLHLAASLGNLQSIKLLLDFGHKVDCIDNYGWPPLLYANFRASEECVIMLFEKNPRQIFCLGNLMHEKNPEQRRKNAKVTFEIF